MKKRLQRSQTTQLIERSYPEGVCCNDHGTLVRGVANPGVRSGWAQDTGHNWETLRITLVILEKGSRYLKHCDSVPDEHFPY